MSHHIYTTDAYIFGHDFNRDADSMIYMFTKELGYIRAVAAGSRYEKSKHRYALQDYSYCTLSLVKGKGGWRITSALAHHNLYAELHDMPEFGAMYVKMIKLLKRFLTGEDPHPELFSIFHESVQAALQNGNNIDVKILELLTILYIVSSLGYASVPTELQEMKYTKNECEYAKDNQHILTKSINGAIYDSHL